MVSISNHQPLQKRVHQMASDIGEFFGSNAARCHNLRLGRGLFLTVKTFFPQFYPKGGDRFYRSMGDASELLDFVFLPLDFFYYFTPVEPKQQAFKNITNKNVFSLSGGKWTICPKAGGSSKALMHWQSKPLKLLARVGFSFVSCHCILGTVFRFLPAQSKQFLVQTGSLVGKYLPTGPALLNGWNNSLHIGLAFAHGLEALRSAKKLAGWQEESLVGDVQRKRKEQLILLSRVSLCALSVFRLFDPSGVSKYLGPLTLVAGLIGTTSFVVSTSWRDQKKSFNKEYLRSKAKIVSQNPNDFWFERPVRTEINRNSPFKWSLLVEKPVEDVSKRLSSPLVQFRRITEGGDQLDKLVKLVQSILTGVRDLRLLDQFAFLGNYFGDMLPLVEANAFLKSALLSIVPFATFGDLKTYTDIFSNGSQSDLMKRIRDGKFFNAVGMFGYHIGHFCDTADLVALVMGTKIPKTAFQIGSKFPVLLSTGLVKKYAVTFGALCGVMTLFEFALKQFVEQFRYTVSKLEKKSKGMPKDNFERLKWFFNEVVPRMKEDLRKGDHGIKDNDIVDQVCNLINSVTKAYVVTYALEAASFWSSPALATSILLLGLTNCWKNAMKGEKKERDEKQFQIK